MDGGFSFSWAGILHSCPDEALAGGLDDACGALPDLPSPANSDRSAVAAPRALSPAIDARLALHVDSADDFCGHGLFAHANGTRAPTGTCLSGSGDFGAQSCAVPLRSASLPPQAVHTDTRGRKVLSGRLSPVGLAALFRRMRAQVVGDRRPFMCDTCLSAVDTMGSAGSTASLTHMLRVLCDDCRPLFCPGQGAQSAGLGERAPGVHTTANAMPTPASTPGPGHCDAQAHRVITRIILRAPPGQKVHPAAGKADRGHVSAGGQKTEGRHRADRNRNADPTRKRPGNRLETVDLPVYALLLDACLDWCRLCGFIPDASNPGEWQPGPWGMHSFCRNHTLPPALTMSPVAALPERLRPIVQDYCSGCKLPCVPAGAGELPQSEAVAAAFRPSSFARCFGCPRTFHTACLRRAFPGLSSGRAARLAHKRWFCTEACRVQHGRAVALAAAALCGSDDTDNDDSLSANDDGDGLSETEPISQVVIPKKAPRIRHKKAVVKSETAKSIEPTRRYAKLLAGPPTPPSSPPGAQRKRRPAASHVSPDELAAERILVCFESSAALSFRNTAIARERIGSVHTPSFSLATPYPPLQECAPMVPVASDELALLECTDTLQRRHDRYEAVEKRMRLCQPSVLRSLHASAGSLAEDIFSSSAREVFSTPAPCDPSQGEHPCDDASLVLDQLCDSDSYDDVLAAPVPSVMRLARGVACGLELEPAPVAAPGAPVRI